jgi:glutamine synthetase
MPPAYAAGTRWYFSRMDLAGLRESVASGEIDTVLLAATDMQGRLQGKRMDATHFLEDVAEHHAEACSYLLATDVEMETVPGFSSSSWETGYQDFRLIPDLSTLRPVPWHERTALCLADIAGHDGTPLEISPRQVLRAQLERLAERGWRAMAATELEFIVFEDTYEQAWDTGYRRLTPANRYNVDYSLMGTARVEPLIGRIRREMTAAGMVVEASKGECNLGQHEINFRYDEALAAADGHVFFKNSAKEIAAQEECSITFMAKYDELEGNSCHVHLSLADDNGGAVFGERPEVFQNFVAGVLAGARELTLLHAPNVNSYKRFADGSFAPTVVSWGADNRTCTLREVGTGAARRIEWRLPGADVNPYLSLAALIAAGLDGVERGLEPPAPLAGNAYTTQAPRVPATLAEARDCFASSELAPSAFGQPVVDHYLKAADVELAFFNAAVTDWERVRGFERL